MSVNNNLVKTTQTQTLAQWKNKIPPFKYAGIITSFVLFSVLSATACIYNHNSVAKVENAKLYADFSARQDLLARSIASEMMKVKRLDESKKDGQKSKEKAYADLEVSAQTLKDTVKEFDDILNSLRGGGTLTDPLGGEVMLQALKDPASSKHLTEIKELWTPYKDNIENIIQAINKKDTNIDTSLFTDEYPHFINKKLIDTIQLLEKSSLKHADSVKKKFKNLQMTLLMIVFMLSIFAIWALYRFLKEDAELSLSKQQTDEMLAHITQGLCLLDSNLVISKQHSQALEQATF